MKTKLQWSVQLAKQTTQRPSWQSWSLNVILLCTKSAEGSAWACMYLHFAKYRTAASTVIFPRSSFLALIFVNKSAKTSAKFWTEILHQSQQFSPNLACTAFLRIVPHGENNFRNKFFLQYFVVSKNHHHPLRQLEYRAATKLLHPCLSRASLWMVPQLWFSFKTDALKNNFEQNLKQSWLQAFWKKRSKTHKRSKRVLFNYTKHKTKCAFCVVCFVQLKKRSF